MYDSSFSLKYNSISDALSDIIVNSEVVEFTSCHSSASTSHITPSIEALIVSLL